MTVIAIDVDALHAAVQQAMKNSRPMKAAEWMKTHNRNFCLCCICYKEMKLIYRFLTDELPVCKKCSFRLGA